MGNGDGFHGVLLAFRQDDYGFDERCRFPEFLGRVEDRADKLVFGFRAVAFERRDSGGVEQFGCRCDHGAKLFKRFGLRDHCFPFLAVRNPYWRHGSDWMKD